ncbi:acyl-CoA thioesterase [Saccharopolyspora elongata]|uniref:Acyl-CoA thioesterase 2 n=1 Tax=Saccharopolyspora elongata TaxID=2530387 RepID=A0A4R4YEB3_9PSEU|nr:acyl-CoA thioesterase II [Saccharopolyspora elongata]TDD42450.1 acyl-CoA thioesterase II [Saccharopolyspora elongata]
MTSDLDAAAPFTKLIELERVEENLYRGTCHPGAPLTAFGGHVAAQSLIAAGSTVPVERAVHSLHGYFIRPGRTDRPIVYQVDRTREGASFTTRRVVAVQDGETIFSLSASFQRSEDSEEHQVDMPEVPQPGSPAAGRSAEDEAERQIFQGALETRRIADSRQDFDTGQGPQQKMWVRVVGELPDDPLVHACALTYTSDVRLASTAYLPFRDAPVAPRMASLDHAVWFHRPFRADTWLLFTMDSPSYASSRGLTRGQFFTQNGELVASVVQEVLIRKRKS